MLLLRIPAPSRSRLMTGLCYRHRWNAIQEKKNTLYRVFLCRIPTHVGYWRLDALLCIESHGLERFADAGGARGLALTRLKRPPYELRLDVCKRRTVALRVIALGLGP